VSVSAELATMPFRLPPLARAIGPDASSSVRYGAPGRDLRDVVLGVVGARVLAFDHCETGWE